VLVSEAEHTDLWLVVAALLSVPAIFAGGWLVTWWVL
jgi:hypothetical protein